MVVQNQEGGYDWGKTAQEDASHAYIAEICEANMADAVSDMVDEVLDYSLISNNDDSFPIKDDDMEEDANVAVTPKVEKKIEAAECSDKEIKVEIPENLSIEELVSYMANLNAPDQKVSFSLSSFVNICKSHLNLSNNVHDLRLEVTQRESLVNSATSERSTLSSQVAVLKDREKELKQKVKSDEKHLTALETEFRQLMARKKLGDEAFEKLTKDFANKQKELADA